MAALALYSMSTPVVSNTNDNFDNLKEEIELIRAVPEFAACNDKYSASVRINPVTKVVDVECGDLANVMVDRGNGLMSIDFGGDKAVISRENPEMVLSDKQAIGLVQMSHMLGEMGYNGKSYPETMPLHFGALSVLKTGQVPVEMLQAIKAVGPDHRRLGNWNGSDDPYDCPPVPHGPGGTSYCSKMDKGSSFCGAPGECLKGVCGDCCFHVGCFGYNYCCEVCSEDEKALMPGGMSDTCQTKQAHLAFEYACDDKFPDFAWCRNNCDDSCEE
eukprot:CAMPEP_0113943862 /NCGR_PEP_ID=MMETSP1339-20121228/28793_1 /TAXON_ID=94617 /ORGANISM="Fibrocapsa japonica" /LENGTH=272 /DNA_ID=CAMNT_0000948837 /DNA_START=84 /DNA_END=902 /DNA_ORIENTATION=+ /assembly_acc=CAM_ASM_000762